MTWITTPTPFRSITRVVQPEVEPVSLFEVKHHLGIMPEVADDDDFLTGLLQTARILVEERLHQTTTATRWRAKIAGWHSCSCRGLELPYPRVLFDPVQFPVEIRWKDRDGNWNDVDPDLIEVDDEEIPGRIHIRESISDACCEAQATIFWWAGHVKPSDVRSPIRTAIKRIVGQCYTSRGDTPETIMADDPAVAAMLAACSISGRY